MSRRQVIFIFTAKTKNSVFKSKTCATKSDGFAAPLQRGIPICIYQTDPHLSQVIVPNVLVLALPRPQLR
ncbi:hypothetical protein Plhal304r1_c053g0137551 [Plasmopara halstedii]